MEDETLFLTRGFVIKGILGYVSRKNNKKISLYIFCAIKDQDIIDLQVDKIITLRLPIQMVFIDFLNIKVENESKANFSNENSLSQIFLQ